MVKRILLILCILLLIAAPLYAVEFDANDDNIFDSTFKFDADNITAGTLGAARLPSTLQTLNAISYQADMLEFFAAADYAAMFTLIGGEPADATIIKEADVDNIPVNAATVAPISSNWAYDHENDADQHPEYLTPSEVTTHLKTTDVDDTPVNAATTDPISSNWAYDHTNDADEHPQYVLEATLGTPYDTEAELDALFAAKLPLSGGTLTGEVTVDNLGLEFTAGDDHSDCSSFAATGGGIFFDDSEGIFKKCQDNVLTDLDSGSGFVDTTGTPVADDIAQFTDDDTVKGMTYAELAAIAGFESALESVLDLQDLQGAPTVVTVTDNESTDEENPVWFSAGGDQDGGDIGPETDGGFDYNPSSGTLTVPGPIETGSNTSPGWDFEDSDTSAVGSAEITVDAATAGYDSWLSISVDDSAGEDTLYTKWDGVSESVKNSRPGGYPNRIILVNIQSADYDVEATLGSNLEDWNGVTLLVNKTSGTYDVTLPDCSDTYDIDGVSSSVADFVPQITICQRWTTGAAVVSFEGSALTEDIRLRDNSTLYDGTNGWEVNSPNIALNTLCIHLACSGSTGGGSSGQWIVMEETGYPIGGVEPIWLDGGNRD